MLSRFWTIRRSDKVFEIKIGLQKKGLHDIVGERLFWGRKLAAGRNWYNYELCNLISGGYKYNLCIS